MDPISGSSYNLNEENSNSNQIFSSAKSLAEYEDKSFRALLPQIIAATVVSLNTICIGISLTYSAILIPQLEADNSDIKATKAQTSWIASVMPLTAPCGALTVGAYLTDKIGRLNALKISAIPGILGWIIIAVSWDIPTLICGRVITGLACALAGNPGVIYITEIARRDMRGSLLMTGPALVSLGMVIGYVSGWILHWRTMAWLSIIYVFIPSVLLFFIPESPVWLVSKEKIEEARKSLQWFHKNQPQPSYKNETFAELHLEQLLKEHTKKKHDGDSSGANTIKAFLKPTGYKPLLILSGVFFFQQFSGIYIFLFYSVSFFDAVGTSVNPYMVSVFIGVIRLFMAFLNSWMLKTFGKRSLMVTSALGMSLSTAISGFFTYKMKTGSMSATYIPIIFLLVYVISSMIGLLPIPWTMTAEMFPLKIRSVAHSLSTSLCNVMMFAAVQIYPKLEETLGGSAGVQWFFACFSAAGAVFIFVFVPETHAKKLSEIEAYFEQHSIYLGHAKKEEKRLSRVLDT